MPASVTCGGGGGAGGWSKLDIINPQRRIHTPISLIHSLRPMDLRLIAQAVKALSHGDPLALAEDIGIAYGYDVDSAIEVLHLISDGPDPV